MQSGATALPLVVELAELDVERPEPYRSSANWPVLSVWRATVRSYGSGAEQSIKHHGPAERTRDPCRLVSGSR